jgi:hypothetical protein
MLPTSVMALFCDDIRAEIGGTVTIVGLLPDNMRAQNQKIAAADGIIEAPEGQRSLSKLCIYTRINFDPVTDIGNPTIHLLGLSEKPMLMGVIKDDIIAKSRQEARERGNIYAGIVFRVAFEGFRFPPRSTNFIIEVTINDQVYVAGSLNIEILEDAISSTAH